MFICTFRLALLHVVVDSRWCVERTESCVLKREENSYAFFLRTCVEDTLQCVVDMQRTSLKVYQDNTFREDLEEHSVEVF